jgi:ADP-ribosylglycohydrolase
MLGVIAGDIIGSVYEARGCKIKTKRFPLFQPASHFTDDTVLTLAIAEAILTGSDYGSALKAFGRRYPHSGYGASFSAWLFADENKPYGSWGNGAAMRVAPVGCAFDTIAEVLLEAERTALPTHNHPEGIKGAQATALAVYLARIGTGRESIRQEIARRFGYDLDRTVDEVRPSYHLNVSCQGTVPEALISFLDASSYEDAVRNAVSLGGDSDTLACIAGGIAQAFYGDTPAAIREKARKRLPADLLDVTDRFETQYGF